MRLGPSWGTFDSASCNSSECRVYKEARVREGRYQVVTQGDARSSRCRVRVLQGRDGVGRVSLSRAASGALPKQGLWS